MSTSLPGGRITGGRITRVLMSRGRMRVGPRAQRADIGMRGGLVGADLGAGGAIRVAKLRQCGGRPQSLLCADAVSWQVRILFLRRSFGGNGQCAMRCSSRSFQGRLQL